ncbi:MAG: glycosyltransferase family 2 protein [Cyclobacteriaceae bacterium]|nr:glycosyltransferase family 2 protein [Cyclobacteriaceae bacterium]
MESKNNLLVSLVIPTFNRTFYLEATIESIVAQKFQYWECIIVDDGSTSQHLAHIENIANIDERLRFIKRSKTPRGAANCRNIGIENAKGNLIIFLDSDDLLAPHCLEHRVKIMKENPNLDFAVFPMLIFKLEKENEKFFWNVVSEEDDLNRFLRLDAVWQTTGPIWRKKTLQKIGGFSEDLHCWQDVDLHLKALLSGFKYKKLYDLPPDCYYRRHNEGSISQNRINTPEKLKSRWQIFTKVFQNLLDFDENWKQKYGKSLEVMLISILFSALTAHNFRFFISKFFRKDTFSVLALIKIFELSLACFCYMSRLTILKRMAQKRIGKSLPETKIGKVAC